MIKARPSFGRPLLGLVFSLMLLVGIAVAQPPPGSGMRKVRVSDPDAAARLVAAGGKLLVDYGAFQLFGMPAAAPAIFAAATNAAGAEPRDDYDTILLNAGPIDTTVQPAQAAQMAVGPAGGKRLHLVHFVGPVRPEWVAELRKTGVEIVTYLPNNAYLIYGDATVTAKASAPAAGSLLAKFMDWNAAYQDSYKIDPAAKTKDAAGKQRDIGTSYFAIQLVADKDVNAATEAFIKARAAGPLLRSERKLNYHDIVAPLAPDRLVEIATRPDVISIQPYFMPRKFDERQDQIIAGNLAGNGPSGPGYLAWLGGAGFSQNQFTVSGFAVDVTDSGVDNGTTSPNHFGLYRGGARPGNSRVIYNRLEGSPNGGSTTRGVDGHGNLNAHIIGGFNNLSGFPHEDAAGFNFGLGVAPYVRVGSSVIFDPNSFTSPSYKDLQSRAYRDGARVSSNSWGANTGGAYTIDSQSYDALVRDAQPGDSAVPVAGNQEMVIIFANGNAGSGAQTVGSPATGKNVISVGAAENVQAFGGADGSGVDDSGADNAGDIIYFSSRGPCADGRKKPEIVAPGTHVSGGVWQTSNPGPNGTADPLFNGTGVSGGILGSRFFPGDGSTQQFYSASSGTSHSTPCVAGGAALVRQYFLNRNLSAPSPAMTKSFLMNTSRYLTGVSANDTLPSNSQGIGEMNLGMAFDSAARYVRDQLAVDKFTATGQARVFNLTVVDPTKPLRISIAWTDAPGSTAGNAYNNDLDLTVVAGGNTYRGNVFTGANSTTGGTADPRNNAESVFLPAGVSGAVTVTVTASSINSNGVPGDADPLDQDFALVAYDALPAGTASVAPNGATIVTESLLPANGLIDNTETVSVNFTLQNSGSTAIGNLVATLQNSGGVTGASGQQTYGAMAVGASATQAFSFTASSAPGSVITATFDLTDGAANLGAVSFSFRLAAGAVPTANGATITLESVVPSNGYIDPGEAVTVDFAVSNAGDRAFGNLTATLQPTGGVLSPSAPQSYGAIPVGGSATRSFTFTGTGAIGSTLTATLQLQDGATNYGTVTYSFRIGPPPDYFTEVFDTTPNDTDNQSWLFTPNGTPSFYGVLRTAAATFPTDPTGGTTLSLSDDTFLQVTPTGGVQLSLYGVSYPTFFVGSNGYVTFGSGDSSLTATAASHFSRPRIAALMDDINPATGGSVTWRQLADRVAVTFQSVPEYGTSNSNSFQIEMFFDGRIRITCLAVAATNGVIGLSRGLGTPSDFSESDFSAYSSLSLLVSAPASATEGVAPATGTVTASTAPASDLVVSLASSDTTEATVPPTATILAGQTSATFPITIVDDAELDGTQVAFISASASGYGSTPASLAVNDNETAVLTLTAPATTGEGAGSIQGTVTISAAPPDAVSINVTSSDTAAIQVPASVVVPGGQTSANFTITVIDDNVINGTHSAILTASVPNWTSGTATIDVLDNEALNLTLSLPATVTEGGTASGTVSTAGTVVGNLTVALASGSTSRLTVPPTVTILAGTSAANFTLTAPNNALTDGTQIVSVSATASGFTAASGTTDVLDNDVHHFAISPIASPQIRGVAFSVSIAARDVNDVTIGSYTGTPALSATGSAGTVTISPSTAGPFVNGVWTGNVTAGTFSNGVLLTVDDGSGHTGTSNAFDVGTGPLNRFGWSAVPSPQSVSLPFSTTVTALDPGNNTVTTFTGTANLSGYTSTGSGSTIVITEANPNTPDEIEFMNVSTSAVDISGWQIHIYDNVSWPAPLTTFTIPNGTVCAAGQIFRLRESGTAPGSFPLFLYGSNIDWTSESGSLVAVLLRNASGTLVDFFAAAGATPSSITSPVPIPASQWSGSAIPGPSNATFGYARTGSSDANTSANWTTATPGLGTANPGLITPFPGASAPVAISPTVTTAFSGGVWTGSVTVQQVATQMRLRADNGSGIVGETGAFNVNALAILAVNPADGFSPAGVLTGPFVPPSKVYSLSNTGQSSLNWTASSNAAWLTLSPASGTLAPGANANVTATINATANALDPGIYNGTITFTNSTSGVGNTTRSAALTLTVPIPVLNPEPPITGGTTNTISWSFLPGVDLYEVQRDTTPAFTTPVTSGPISGTTYVFSGVADGPNHYRARARRLLATGPAAWTQTTQGDFASDVANNVSTTSSPGDVVLAPVSVTFTENFDQPGSNWSATMFTDGSYVRDPVAAGATIPNTTPPLPINQGGDNEAQGDNSSVLMANIPANVFAGGSIEANIVPASAGGTAYSGLLLRASRTGAQINGYGAIIANAAASSSLSIYRFTNGAANLVGATVSFPKGVADENLRLRFAASGTTLTASLWRIAVSAGSIVETPITLDGGTNSIVRTNNLHTSGVAGLYSQVTSPINKSLFDDVAVTGGSGYAPAGSITSGLIAPSPLARWRQLVFTADVSGAGTALTVDVLDASGALLAANVASGTDLSLLPAVAAQPALKLRANLSTSAAANTPRLRDWTVSYFANSSNAMDGEWSPVVTSIQDGTAPLLTVTPADYITTAQPSFTLQGTASDAAGIQSVLVNGQAATTGDAFATWNANIPALPIGFSTITIAASDNATPANVTTTLRHILRFTPTSISGNDGLPDQWKMDHGLDPFSTTGINGASGDPEHDGIVNLMERALNLDPQKSDTPGLPSVTIEINGADGLPYLVLAYRRLVDPTGLTYSIETSPDTNTWAAASLGQTEQVSSLPTGDGVTTLVIVRLKPSLNIPGMVAKFVRLRVTAQ